MSDIQLTGDYEFFVKRADSERGEIIIQLEVGSDTVTFEAGEFVSDADALVGALRSLTEDAEQIQKDWEDRPNNETDGFVAEQRGGYSASLEGTVAGYDFPSRDIATYELAKLMADSGTFPDAWYQNERGNTDNIGEEVRKYSDAGRGKLLPLEGVKYAEGDTVLIGTYDYPYVVDRDYGKLGVMLHISGDPSITEFEQHENLRPYNDDDEEG